MGSGQIMEGDGREHPVYPLPVQASSGAIQLDITNGASARVTVTAERKYLLSCTVDCWYLVGTAAVEAAGTTHATAGSHQLFAGEHIEIVTGSGVALAAIAMTAATGQVSLSPLKA